MNDQGRYLAALVVMARELAHRTSTARRDPELGDLVAEVTHRGDPDPHAIGILVGHGDAPYHENDPLDGSVPMRGVWDIRPLSPTALIFHGAGGKDTQRWENATFIVLPEGVGDALGVGRGGPA